MVNRRGTAVPLVSTLTPECNQVRTAIWKDDFHQEVRCPGKFHLKPFVLILKHLDADRRQLEMSSPCSPPSPQRESCPMEESEKRLEKPWEE